MRIIRRPELTERTGLQKSAYERMEAGTFPKAVTLGPNSVGWLEHEVDAWIEARIAARDADAKAA
jgi:prophage regulatory protein